MKKSILSLLVVFTLVLTGCEKESVNSVEASGSITEELGDKSASNHRGLINIGVGNRKINMNGCAIGKMKQDKKSKGIDELEKFLVCVSEKNFSVKPTSNSEKRLVTSPGLASNNGVVTSVPKSVLKGWIEKEINSPSFVSMLQNERLNISGFTVGNVNWPSSSNSGGDFSIEVILTPRSFVFPGF